MNVVRLFVCFFYNLSFVSFVSFVSSFVTPNVSDVTRIAGVELVTISIEDEDD